MSESADPLISIEDLSSYVPTLVLRRFAGESAGQSAPAEERLTAAVACLDISGFTALTERLIRSEASGIEQLTSFLNAYFEPAIEIIAAHGGDVTKMAGDALIALWEARDDGLETAILRAARCALELQERLFEYQVGPRERLSSRVGIDAGELLVWYVGGTHRLWEMVVAGEPVSRLSLLLGLARPGEVVLSASAWSRIAGHAAGSVRESGCVRLDRLVDGPEPVPLNPPRPGPGTETALAAFFPGAILSRLRAGQHDWLAELRQLTVVLVNLPELIGDRPRALEQLQSVFLGILATLSEQGGSVNKLSVDDKGITLIAAMGLPPLVHADDAARGVQAASAIASMLRRMEVRGSVAVTSGPAYCGEIGNRRRREYTMIGEVVNLAARLARASVDGAVCDASTYRMARDRIAFESLTPLNLKGFAEPVAVYRPIGQAQASAAGPICGRMRERTFLGVCLDGLNSGKGTTILIEGGAGIGKSRLIADLLEQAEARGFRRLVGAGDAILGAIPYHAWRRVVAGLLDLEEHGDAGANLQHVHDRLEEKATLAPLLAPLLPFDIPDNALTSQLKEKLRADNTNELIRGMVEKAAEATPAVLVLEDAHWFDSASWAVASLLARTGPAPLLLVLTKRPHEGLSPEEAEDFRALVPLAQRLALSDLAPDDLIRLVCRRLGVDALPLALEWFISTEAQGNPLFAHELALGMREAGLIVVEGGECRIAPGLDPQSLRFPKSLQGVITGRIDRLPPSQQMDLKVASVIGRVFPLKLLHDVHPIEADRARLSEDLEVLEDYQLITLESPHPNQRYMFYHVVTQQVCYNLMLTNQRRQLHRSVVLTYESGRVDDAPSPEILAYHWGCAGDSAKQMVYLARAGIEAMRSGANREVVRSLAEALSIQAGLFGESPAGLEARQERGRWEQLMGEALARMGNTAQAEIHLTKSLRLLGRPAPVRPWVIVVDTVVQVAVQAFHRLMRYGIRSTAAEVEGSPSPRLTVALCLDRMAQIAYFKNDMLRGLHRVLATLNTAESEGHSTQLARSYSGMGILCYLLRLPSFASYYVRRAEDVARATADLETLAYVLMVNAVTRLSAGFWGEAGRMATECARISELLNDPNRLAEARCVEAMRDCFRGRDASALDRFDEVEAIGRRTENLLHQAWGACGRGEILLRQGRTDAAEAELRRALTLLQGEKSRTEEVRARALLAVASLRLGRPDEALSLARAALEIACRYNRNTVSTLEGLGGIVDVFLRTCQGSRSAAEVARVRRALAVMRQHSRVFPVGRPRYLLMKGHWERLSGRPARALRCWRRSAIEACRRRMPLERALALAALATLPHDADVARSTRYASRAGRIFRTLGAVGSETAAATPFSSQASRAGSIL